MACTLPPLPFDKGALEPHVSAETITYHYEKHHGGYVNKLNKAIEGTEYDKLTLPEIIMKAEGNHPIFNNAAQVWNHTFYWYCIKPGDTAKPTSAFTSVIDKSFGSLEDFCQQFKEKAMGTFGSGWVWLVKNSDNTLRIVSTSNAGTPMTSGQTALLTCDVWEHAYYIDTRNDRGLYLDRFKQLINWEFVERNFSGQYREEEAKFLL